MSESKSILHELYVFSEWKPEPEYLQKPDNILPENISALWRWLKFLGPKKRLIDSVTAHKEKQQKWHIALGDEGKVIAVLTDNILEIRTKRTEYATIAARTTVSRDAYAPWRKLVWSPDCSFLVLAYGNGVVSFFDLTASSLFNIPIDCSRPGGLECTDNTHAVSDIIFMPLRVKDTKWSWEVLVVTFDGRLRGYAVSQTDGCKLRHSFRFPGGVAALAHCAPHDALYVAGVPRGVKDPSSPLSAGITAWRILNDDPYYKLSVVSDQLEGQLANERFQLYIPFVTSKHLNFIVRMELSGDNTKLVCVHCNGDVSLWRLPLLKLLKRWPLACQPSHDLRNPLVKSVKPTPKDMSLYYPADVNWWSNEEIIVSRFSGAVSVCDVDDMVNILGKKPEFFQGTPQVTRAHDGAFMALECESSVLPAKKSRSAESMEVVKVEEETDDSMMELTKELFKTVLYAITDMETFQPKPKRITVVSRIYRLLGVKSTTPMELFSRKIEGGHYSEALTLAETFGLDSDLVYQQQWRKNPVSTDAIQKYLSKVSKKIWAVHQCVDRLPETLPAAKELLQFGMQLTNERILDEINKDKSEDEFKTTDDITLEDLNAYTSELLRCRHVMLFYKERLWLYEAILKCEKSSYIKDEYDRLRSNGIVHSAIEIAKEGRIEALTCLWPHVKTTAMQMAVLENLPETANPLDYQHLLPTVQPLEMFEHKSPVKIKPMEPDNDWCRKEIFRSIWSSNWSEDASAEAEAQVEPEALGAWYTQRACDVERRSGLAAHALALASLAAFGGSVPGMERVLFHLITLVTLIYDINLEGVTLEDVENMSVLDTCLMLMKMSTPATFVSDLKQFVVPFLKRYEILSKRSDACITGLTDFLQSISVDDLSSILLVLQSPNQFELDVRTHLELAEKCLLAHTNTDQLDMACDLLNTILKESDGSISNSELVRRVAALERLVGGASRAAWRGVFVPLRELRDMLGDEPAASRLLARIARSHKLNNEKPTEQDWDNILKDILELQSTLFDCVPREQCYEIYASALLASGDAASVRLAAHALTCSHAARRPRPALRYERSVRLVLASATEYFNSASSLTDPALELAKCCLTLIEDENDEIEQELGLIASLQILSSFGLTILPIQVRLCENKMNLIKECMKSDHRTYLASHKLLKLAKMLMIAGDDEQTREGLVLHLVGEHALEAGPAGAAAAVSAARRLAALRYAPAARHLAAVATRAHAHADMPTRRALLAAAAANLDPSSLHEVLRARQSLEIESLQQLGAALREHNQWATRAASTDDEFADAITTPVIEKKDLVVPPQSDKKTPLFNYLLETFQSKFNLSESKEAAQEAEERSVHCPEFYRSLYPEHKVSQSQYGYESFSLPEHGVGPPGLGQAVLKWFYVHNSLEDCITGDHEAEVVQKCAEKILYKDTPLSVACLLRSTQDCNESLNLVEAQHSAAAASAVLYAALVKCNSPELRDNVYLAEPRDMARATLAQGSLSEAQLRLVRGCVQRLAAEADLHQLRRLGLVVSGPLFIADEDYRREIIYRLARSESEERVVAAVALGRTHGLDALDVWLAHAAHVPPARRALRALPADYARPSHMHQRIMEALWPLCSGSAHSELMSVLSLLQHVDERSLIHGLTAAEHIKLLKKAKAASSELDYKLLLEQPSPERLTAHLLGVMRPDNVAPISKFLRALPPALHAPVALNALYTLWLTQHFFSLPANASNKKWMQQYRQCASYFNKLTKDDLLRFVANTCFSSTALQRVPAGTRNLMIMQAVDYCQQEQENDYKFNKIEQSWSQVAQELTRWARFLENFHSSSVQALIDTSDIPRDQIWPELEMSHGEPETAAEALGRLAVRGLRSAALVSLLHCLHVDALADPHHVFQHLLARCVHDLEDMQSLAARVAQYHKEGVKFPEELIEAVLQRARELELPPHKQLGLLALSGRSSLRGAEDLEQLAHSTAELFRNEWPDEACALQLKDETLLTEEGRRETFSKFMALSNTWQKKKALVDVLNCWPTTGGSGTHDPRSLHCEYLHSLLSTASDQNEARVLIKLLLRHPVLYEEEVKWLCENTPTQSVLNAVWTVLLNKCEHSKELILQLVLQHKDSVQMQEAEDDLIKELLDNGLFIPLVPTPLYSSIINYIINKDSENPNDEPTDYTLSRASNELKKANYIAEAGHLHLLYIGVPSSLRGFTQSVLYFKNIFNQ